MTFLAQQYPEEIAALKSDEGRQWHSWGNGSHTGCSFDTGRGVKTLAGKLRRGRMAFYGVFDGIYPRDIPLRPANERCATAAENGLMLLWSPAATFDFSQLASQNRGRSNNVFSSLRPTVGAVRNTAEAEGHGI